MCRQPVSPRLSFKKSRSCARLASFALSSSVLSSFRLITAPEMMLRSTSLLLERLRFFFFFRSFFSRLRSFFFRFFSLRRRRDSELSLELELLSSSDFAGAASTLALALVPALKSSGLTKLHAPRHSWHKCQKLSCANLRW